eukprot:7015411-Pyramimonas_sp.AAC.1
MLVCRVSARCFDNWLENTDDYSDDDYNEEALGPTGGAPRGRQALVKSLHHRRIRFSHQFFTDAICPC